MAKKEYLAVFFCRCFGDDSTELLNYQAEIYNDGRLLKEHIAFCNYGEDYFDKMMISISVFFRDYRVIILASGNKDFSEKEYRKKLDAIMKEIDEAYLRVKYN